MKEYASLATAEKLVELFEQGHSLIEADWDDNFGIVAVMQDPDGKKTTTKMGMCEDASRLIGSLTQRQIHRFH